MIKKVQSLAIMIHFQFPPQNQLHQQKILTPPPRQIGLKMAYLKYRKQWTLPWKKKQILL